MRAVIPFNPYPNTSAVTSREAFSLLCFHQIHLFSKMSSFGFSCPPQTMLYQTLMWHGAALHYIIFFFASLNYMLWNGQRKKMAKNCKRKGNIQSVESLLTPFPASTPMIKGCQDGFSTAYFSTCQYPSEANLMFLCRARHSPNSNQVLLRWNSSGRHVPEAHSLHSCCCATADAHQCPAHGTTAELTLKQPPNQSRCGGQL